MNGGHDPATAPHPHHAFTLALVGNPNAGKTTLFNALTGLHAKTANFPGTTVERKVGRLHLDHKQIEAARLHLAENGLAAFGVGPLQSAVGLSLEAIYGGSAIVALALSALAFVVVRPENKTSPTAAKI